MNWEELAGLIERWSREQGFSASGISDISLDDAGANLQGWLSNGYAGQMDYMSRHGEMRWHPEQLHPKTQSIISVRMDYLEKEPDPEQILATETQAYVARYALGRDYHKVIRQRLKKLIEKIRGYLAEHEFESLDARVFTDSAPLLEKAIAEKAGLGWIGKNTLLLNEKAGSWFFLGEILTNLPLPASKQQATNRCGSCSACIDVCPTDAIVAPYELDARKCISYLTIELRGRIPEELRAPIGNRIFGCDDCQLVCPWNRYAKPNNEPDFAPRHGLADSDLIDLFEWTEDEFLKRTEGSAIRRTGYQGWLRNLAVALGNAKPDPHITRTLRARKGHSDLVDEHIDWALTKNPKKD